METIVDENSAEEAEEVFVYRLVQSTCWVDGEGFTVYGIEVTARCGNEARRVVVENICDERDVVETLMRRMEEGRVCPAHLKDIVEDFLEERYGVDL